MSNFNYVFPSHDFLKSLHNTGYLSARTEAEHTSIKRYTLHEIFTKKFPVYLILVPIGEM